MLQVFVKGFGPAALKRLEINCRRMTLQAMREIANEMTKEMIKRAPEWKGHLKASIKANPVKRSGVGVSMIFYGPMLEKGHRLPTPVPYVKLWAREKLPMPERWLRIVGMYGWFVRSPRPEFGRPFIKPSIDSVSQKIPFIMLKNLRKV